MDPDNHGEGQEYQAGQETREPGEGGGSAGEETDIDGMPVRYATTGSHPALTALAITLVIILVLVVAAYGTMETEIGLPPVPGATYPYTTTYSAVIPAGQQVTVAGVPLVVIHADDTLQVVVNGRPEEFIPGEPYMIARGTAQVSSLGIEISRTGYQVDAIYEGAVGTSADLSLVIMTTEKASSRLVKALLPAGVEITPG